MGRRTTLKGRVVWREIHRATSGPLTKGKGGYRRRSGGRTGHGIATNWDSKRSTHCSLGGRVGRRGGGGASCLLEIIPCLKAITSLGLCIRSIVGGPGTMMHGSYLVHGTRSPIPSPLTHDGGRVMMRGSGTRARDAGSMEQGS